MADKLDSREVFKRFFNLKAGDYPLSPKPDTDPGVNKEWKWDTQNNKWVTVSVKTEPLSNGQQNGQQTNGQTNGSTMVSNGVSTYDTGMYTQAGIESLTDYNNYTTENGFDYPVARQATRLDTSKYPTVKDYVCSKDFMQDIVANTKEEYDAQCSRPIKDLDELMYEAMTLDEILDEGWKCFKQYKIQSGMGILMQSGLYNFDDGSYVESSKEYEDIDSSKYPWVITDTKTDAVTPIADDELTPIFEEKLFSENVYHLPPDRDYRETERRNLKKQKEKYKKEYVKSDDYSYTGDSATFDDSFMDEDISFDEFSDDDGYLSEGDAMALVRGSRRRRAARRAGRKAIRRAGRHYIGRIVRRSSMQRRRAYAEGTVGSLSLRDVTDRIYDAVDAFVREQGIDEDPMTVVTTYDGPDGLVLRVYVDMSRDDMERLGPELDDIVAEICDAGFFEASPQGDCLSVMLDNVGTEYCDDDDGYETCMASRRMARHLPRRMAHRRMPHRRMAGRVAGRISRIPMGRLARKSRLVRSRRLNRHM